MICLPRKIVRAFIFAHQLGELRSALFWWIDRVSTVFGVRLNAVLLCFDSATPNSVASLDRIAFNRN